MFEKCPIFSHIFAGRYNTDVLSKQCCQVSPYKNPKIIEKVCIFFLISYTKLYIICCVDSG